MQSAKKGGGNDIKSTGIRQGFVSGNAKEGLDEVFSSCKNVVPSKSAVFGVGIDVKKHDGLPIPPVNLPPGAKVTGYRSNINYNYPLIEKTDKMQLIVHLSPYKIEQRKASPQKPFYGMISFVGSMPSKGYFIYGHNLRIEGPQSFEIADSTAAIGSVAIQINKPGLYEVAYEALEQIIKMSDPNDISTLKYNKSCIKELFCILPADATSYDPSKHCKKGEVQEISKENYNRIYKPIKDKDPYFKHNQPSNRHNVTKNLVNPFSLENVQKYKEENKKPGDPSSNHHGQIANPNTNNSQCNCPGSVTIKTCTEKSGKYNDVKIVKGENGGSHFCNGCRYLPSIEGLDLDCK